MDLITTHINADFDALGSLVAAKKIYPNSRLMLPGSQEEAVREFLSLAKELIMVESERECNLDDIDRLILVDTRHKSRIGIASELVDKGVAIHIYDHHPSMKGDIVADKDIYEEVGATVTILVDMVKTRRVKVSPLEATLMLLGIYEETGSLTYRTTTNLDVDMVSFLLSCGASLSMVSSYLNRELSKGELSLLAKLIELTERVLIKGVSVSMIEIESSSYIGELGMVVHKLMDIENIPLLFVFIKTPRQKRVDIIGRSKIAAVDLNKVLSHFGGGGHSSAASAKIRDADFESVKEKLIKVLKSQIRVKVYAKDIMSKDFKTLNMDRRVDEARKVLLQENLGGMPVMDRTRVVGIITLEGLNKAIKRRFGHSRIKGYMTRNFVTVKANTSLASLKKIVVDRDIGVLPVLKRGKIIGVINRTDILKNIHSGLFVRHKTIERKVILNLSKKMASLLPRDIMRLLKDIGALANRLGYTAFVVGGLTRDLVLGRKNLDLDIVIEGDAIKFGHTVSKKLKATIVVHKRFGTCSVITKDGLKIDLATARKEIYERPAALPTVEFARLKDDLIRRDFTINAMAISLNKSNFGQLIDFFGGEDDLRRGRIRIMHDASFIDDPTRIFRAVRFEQRFGFVIDNHTEELIKNAIKEEMFEKVDPQRIRDEIILILKEENPLKALKRMAELDELRFLHPDIKLKGDLINFYNSVEGACAWYEAYSLKKRPVDRWLMYLMALFDNLSYKDLKALCDKFVFKRGDRLRLLSYKKHGRLIGKVLSSRAFILPSRIYKLLQPLAFEVILLVMARSGSRLARSRIKNFFQKYNGMRISVRGDDIKKCGLEPSPDFKIILKKILYEKIDGKLKTRKDELIYARRLAKRLCG